MTDFWQRLKERKLVQWALAYLAAAFAFLQGIDIVAQCFGWRVSIDRSPNIASRAAIFFARWRRSANGSLTSSAV